MAQLGLRGARLAYVVNALPGTVMRPKHILGEKVYGKDGPREKRKKVVSWKVTEVEEPAGFMVYFPRGHCLRIPTLDLLEHYGLQRAPRVLNTDGMADPTNPLNKMLVATSDASRKEAFAELEKAVIRNARRVPGADSLTNPEQEAA